MGVKGWTKFLTESGWLPSSSSSSLSNNCCCCLEKTSLWRHDPSSGRGNDEDFVSRIETIPTSTSTASTTDPTTTFLIDGHGFAFHLLSVAYARHASKVLSSSSSSATNNNFKSNNNNSNSSKRSSTLLLKHLTPYEVQQLIPTWIPLKLLEQVTEEYITTLHQHNIKPVVYWDGSARKAVKQTTTDLKRESLITDEWDNNGSVAQLTSVKQTTDRKRRSRIDDEWDTLRSFCLYGILPEVHGKHKNNNNSKYCNCMFCEWYSCFPKPRNFICQIKHTLNRLHNIVTTKYCVEECDHIIARDAYNNPRTYVLGNDSDFCFFPNIQYIPFNTLAPSSSANSSASTPTSSSSFSHHYQNQHQHYMMMRMSACVIRRQDLAQYLDLPNDNLMIELAILCGNDYLVEPQKAKLDFNFNFSLTTNDDTGNNNNNTTSTAIIEDWCEYLSAQEPGYQLTSQCCDITEVLHFVRALYSLDNLDEFPFEDDKNNNTGQVIGVANANTSEATTITTGIGGGGARLTIPKNVDFSTVKIDPAHDRSVKDSVLRFLEAYLNRSAAVAGYSPPSDHILTPLHVYVFRSMNAIIDDDEQEAAEILSRDPTWRPRWDDEFAVYFISRSVAACIENNSGMPLVRFASPSSVFFPYLYHVKLQRARNAAMNVTGNNGDLTPSLTTSTPPYPDTPLLSNESDRSQKWPPQPVEVSPSLPVDEHEETILRAIEKNRVTIVQGGTGSGKSSRIPVMILNAPPPDPAMKRVKLYISQPRRIAAKALVERLRAVEPELKSQFALRMGHGHREYERPETRAWFVTAGYLVRRLASRPDIFNDVSHLIIDECHERSVETDLLVLLCRRLLETNKHIRLVLMSATLAAKLYQEYFNTSLDNPIIEVGARRFPVEEVYVEDIETKFVLNSKLKTALQSIQRQCTEFKCKQSPTVFYLEKLYPVVAQIALMVGQPGSSVLVFVPGMVDIVAITEAIEQLHVPGIRFNCFPIHGDIPFEDQMDVFEASQEDEVKVIIATNAAESSVTLPEVDNVICLGLCKQIVYNETSHRQMLIPTWISRASATQRAGRTGRLRPGTVYRLYTRQNYEKDMDEFEPGEISRIPLDNVILMLKGMLVDDNVTDVLLNTLEPPNVSTIDRSFQSLFQSHFITAPSDDCQITTLGNFVSSLGIDLALGSLIGLGIQFGVGAEAVMMAGVLSFPKSPWIMSSPLIHEPKEYNEMTKRSYMSKCNFDANLFSEPLATMNMLYAFEHKSERKQAKWCWENGLHNTRVRRCNNLCDNLRQRVADFFEIDEDLLRIKQPPSQFPHSQVTQLRVIQAWVFHDNVIECHPNKAKIDVQKEGVALRIHPRSDPIDNDNLEQILCTTRHPFTLRGVVKREERYSLMTETDFSVESVMATIGERFVSYAIEKDCLLAWFWDKNCTVIFLNEAALPGDSLPKVFRILNELERKVVVAEKNKSRRGIGERTCGQWKLQDHSSELHQSSVQRVFQMFIKVPSTKKERKNLKQLHSKLAGYMLNDCSVQGIACDFSKKATGKSKPFTITSYGHGLVVSDADLRDLVVSTNLQIEETTVSTQKQMIMFPTTPLPGCNSSSWGRPPVDCIPEGARLLSVLASGRRREHLVRLDALNESEEESAEVDLYLDPSQTKLSQRWNRFETDLAVYVNENCVPATALPVQGKEVIYCVAANTLEVRGGGIRVEGLTLLPSGPLFLLLTRVSFGLFSLEEQEDYSTLEDKCVQWLWAKKPQQNFVDGEEKVDLEMLEWRRRINMAFDFHESSLALGEELVCFPDMARALQIVFLGVDNYVSDNWDIESNVFTRRNIETAKKNHRGRSPFSTSKYKGRNEKQKQQSAKTPITNADYSQQKKPLSSHNGPGPCENMLEADPTYASSHIENEENHLQGTSHAQSSVLPVVTSVEQLDEDALNSLQHLFATDGQDVPEHEFPSTNLLALIVEHVYQSLGIHEDSLEWSLYAVKVDGHRTLYEARFANRNLWYMEPKEHLANLPKWFCKSVRPCTLRDALACVPPMFKGLVSQSAEEVSTEPSSAKKMVAFTSIEMALRTEAAFWLERQFFNSLHWYEQGDVSDMIARLVRECQSQDQFSDAPLPSPREQLPVSPAPLTSSSNTRIVFNKDEMLSFLDVKKERPESLPDSTITRGPSRGKNGKKKKSRQSGS